MTRTPPAAAPPAPHRYDRQIRLWGEEGQAALQRASICLINANPLGTEALKNLVLPGIAAFTVVDGAALTESDPGANFFTPPSPAFSNRAHAAMAALAELNPAVDASYIPHHVASFIRSPAQAAAFASRFTLVIATQLRFSSAVLRHLAEGCALANIPLVLARACGFIGYVRLQAAELTVLDARDASLSPDLRLDAPFPELAEYVSSFDLSKVHDSTVASHIPFVVILAQAVAKFRAGHAGRLPASRAEKDELKEIVRGLRPPSCPADAENFEEATKNSFVRLCHSSASELLPELRSILANEKSDPNSSASFKPAESKVNSDEDHTLPEVIRQSRRPMRGAAQPAAMPDSPPAEPISVYRVADENLSFWVHAAAIRVFHREHGMIPVRGSLPDMASDTESYVALQRLYSRKADADARQVVRFGLEIVERYGLDVDLDEASVRRFCKNLGSIRVVETRSIEEELGSKGSGGEFAEAAMVDGALDACQTGSAAPYYALLRAIDMFHKDVGRAPGAEKADTCLMFELLNRVKEALGLSVGQPLWRDECAEMVRYGDSEMHNVCAFVGGVVAQEVTKIITRVFVPLQCVVFDLSEQRSFSFAP